MLFNKLFVVYSSKQQAHTFFKTMLSTKLFSQRRRAIQQLPSITNPNESSSCICCSKPLFFFILFIIILCSLSLYLSTKILNEQESYPNDINNTNQESEKAINNIQHNNKIKEYNNNNNNKLSKNEVYDNDDPALTTAIKKSLSYLLRDGHQDRVEYMIGFRGERMKDALKYMELAPRNINKMYVCFYVGVQGSKIKINIIIHNRYDRDYIKSSPIAISTWHSQPESEIECDANCIGCIGGIECDVGGIKWSMENVEVGESPNTISGSTRLDSLVPVPYFSYYDFGFMTPVNKEKTSSGLAAAFISNCGFPKRNQMVKDLQKYGVSVDSYGRCEHNKDEERKVGGREQTKIDLLSTHKFSLAFENSETDDYISEKFFGSLVSGSIPVYIGAPNIKFYAPDAGNKDIGGPGKPWKSHSLIWAGDFNFDANKLAKYLLYV